MTDQGKHDDPSAATGFRPMSDIVLVLTFLTRLPLPNVGPTGYPLARAVWAFPLAGIIVGGVGGGIAFGLALMGAPIIICVVLGVIATVLVSGALHEDGLADVADGFGGGTTPEKKREIMHDSRIGSYGVLVLILGVGLRVAALFTIADMVGEQGLFLAFLVGATMSRGLLPGVMAGLPNARTDGLSKSVGRPGPGGVVFAFALGAACALALFRDSLASTVIALVCSVVAVMIFCLLAKRQIGGQTGDVIGAAQQIGEVAFLVTLSILLGNVT